MILELVLINQETGEPVYQAALTKVTIMQSIGNECLQNHAHLMLRAVEQYKPRNIAPRAHQLFTTEASQGREQVEDLGDLNGPTNMGY